MYIKMPHLQPLPRGRRAEVRSPDPGAHLGGAAPRSRVAARRAADACVQDAAAGVPARLARGRQDLALRDHHV